MESKKNEHKVFYYQQGDVLLKRIDKLPEGLEKLNTLVLQEGETTGHKHQFAQGMDVQVYQGKIIGIPGIDTAGTITPNLGKFIVVGDQAVLRHEEHRAIPVESGIYEVDIVREFDYDTMEMNRVRD